MSTPEKNEKGLETPEGSAKLAEPGADASVAAVSQETQAAASNVATSRDRIETPEFDAKFWKQSWLEERMEQSRTLDTLSRTMEEARKRMEPPEQGGERPATDPSQVARDTIEEIARAIENAKQRGKTQEAPKGGNDEDLRTIEKGLEHGRQLEEELRKEQEGAADYYDEIVRLRQELTAQQKTMEALASFLAHNINHLLTPITGFAELLAIDETSEKKKGFLSKILQSGNAIADTMRRVILALQQGAVQKFLMEKAATGSKQVAPAEGAAKDATGMQSVEAPRKKGNILVVDDEEIVRELLEAMLKEDGHTVTMASSAAEAKKAIESRKFDLIICDFNMPGGNGDEVAKEAATNGIPLVILSGRGDSLKNVSGAREVVSKPIELSALRKLTAKYLPKPAQEADKEAGKE